MHQRAPTARTGRGDSGEIPDLAEGEVLQWGKRYLSSDAAETYKQQGYLLCVLRLPVQPMGRA